MKILVTGGAGYIGSHTCVELLKKNYDVVVLDNFSNSCEESLNRVQNITRKKLSFYEADLLKPSDIHQVFKDHKIDAVIHFAGLKAVGESVTIPLKYYHNNLTGTFNLLSAMDQFNVKNLVFSSSATVYGDPTTLPITEEFPLCATNPYGRTKLIIEEVLQDLYQSDKSWSIALLRYFNPVGAHESGQIGEDPQGLPNNLMPYISQVAVGLLPRLSVFGSDYNTPDGTGVRDYIHVTDLALGHILTLPKLTSKPGVATYNLGTGNGFSVLEIIKEFEKASNQKISYQITDRRPGDIATCFADSSKAKKELGWETTKSLEDMCKDTWNWQKNNPEGYRKHSKED
ncbi:MAG: UDP-glucose 4-epimerase GalE [Desulfobacteraceae bacterium]|nr:UDP-glucose 4-epimerase GalE [Desulfobacteraceae bacterium]